MLLAALGLAVLAIAIVAIRHPDGRTANAGVITTHVARTTSEPSKSAPATHAASTGAGATSPGPTSSTGSATGAKLPLIVLNNTTVTKLAAEARTTFEAGGWTVTRIGNLQNDILSTCAYYDPAVAGAQAAADALRAQFPAIKRVAPKFAELPAGPIVVVLTPDYTSG